MKPVFQAIEPRIPVSDLKASLDFYRKLLGIDPGDTVMVTEDHGFAILRKGKIGIQLVSQSPAHPLFPVLIWIDIVGVAAFHERVKDDFPIEWGPEVYAYGRREFCVGDPDKHRIVFSENAGDPVTCKE